MLRDRKTKKDKASATVSKPARPGWAKASVPGDPRLPMRTRQVVGHVSLTGNTGTAWYRLDPVPWSFRPDRDREQHILTQASVLAGLSGQLVRIRGTQVPFPVREWAETHHRLVTERQAAFGAVPLPCWPDLLAGEQRQFLGRAPGRETGLPRCRLPAPLPARPARRRGAAEVVATTGPGTQPAAVEAGGVGHVDGPTGDARPAGDGRADGVAAAPLHPPRVPRPEAPQRAGRSTSGVRGISPACWIRCPGRRNPSPPPCASPAWSTGAPCPGMSRS